MEGVARDIVAQANGDAVPARVVVNLLVPDSLMELLDAAAAAREDRDRVSVEAVTLRRGLARRLAAEGFAVRDVAGLLGLSIARAQQLVGDGSQPPRRSKARSTGPSRPLAGGPQLPVPAAGKAHIAYQHEAFVYRGQDDFLAGTVPFVLDGVARSQPVMIAVTAPRLGLLQAAIGADTPGVHFVDMQELGANPARIIPAWRSFVDEYGGRQRPVRGIGEPVWAGRRATEVVECQLHEALLNLAVEPDTPLWLICPYDADLLAPPVLEEASRSHPSVRESGSYRGSTTYGGVHHADTLFGGYLPEPPPRTPSTTFLAADIREVGRQVRRFAVTSGLHPDRATDLVWAVTEVATNSIRHGGGRGTLRLWRQGDSMISEVTDAGHITDSMVGRRAPSPASETGRGLWLANQLCDLLQVRSGPGGTTVRLHSWLPGSAPEQAAT